MADRASASSVGDDDAVLRLADLAETGELDFDSHVSFSWSQRNSATPTWCAGPVLRLLRCDRRPVRNRVRRTDPPLCQVGHAHPNRAVPPTGGTARPESAGSAVGDRLDGRVLVQRM